MTDQPIVTHEAAVKNIYQKLQEARVRLGSLNLKKTGENKYSNFTYYELSDFLPSVNKINNDLGLMTFFEIKKNESGEKIGYLEIINSEEPNQVLTFSSETANVEIGKKSDGKGGASDIQNIGGKQTYLRRYLFIMAYEFSESDLVDAEGPSKPAKSLDKMTIDQIMATKTKQELIDVCKALVEKDPAARDSIEEAFAIRKRELLKEDEPGGTLKRTEINLSQPTSAGGGGGNANPQ